TTRPSNAPARGDTRLGDDCSEPFLLRPSGSSPPQRGTAKRRAGAGQEPPRRQGEGDLTALARTTSPALAQARQAPRGAPLGHGEGGAAVRRPERRGGLPSRSRQGQGQEGDPTAVGRGVP